MSLSAEALKVLVVDDDSQLVRTLVDILEMNGYHPHGASNGRQGLELAERLPAPVAVALVDLRLPDMDGMELVGRLHALSGLTEVVILTGNASLDSAVKALREQSYDYLIKPVSPPDLLRTLGAAGERWQRRRAEERFRVLLDQLSEIITIAAPDGTIQYQSPAVERVLGYSATERSQQSLFDLVHPEDQATARTLIRDAVDHRHTRSVQLRMRHRDGSWRVLEAIANNLVGHPDVDGIIVTARDVTERNQLEVQLRQSQKMETVGRLAGGIAHDFNNLLTIILTESELARAELPAGHAIRDSLLGIQGAAERAAGLTRQLLAFSRKQIAQPTAFSLAGLVHDMDRMLRRLIGENIELSVSAGPDPGLVRADPAQIEQVLLNLVVNARDAMPAGGRLMIETSRVVLDRSYADVHAAVVPGPYVMLAVTDSGSGMSDEVKAHLFEPFFTTKEQGMGTGLGLATCYGIVRQFEGHIGVYSEIGVGTTVKVYLPRLGDAEQESAAAEKDVGIPGGSETVLFVEDDDGVRQVGIRILQALGYTVLEASDGEAALRMLEQHGQSVRLLLTDVVLPTTGGRALAERAARVRPGIRVLFTSGYTDDVVLRHQLLDRGADFLSKPFTPGSLARKVREVLDRDATDSPGRA